MNLCSSLQLINVDSDNKSLSLHGDLNHSGFYNEECTRLVELIQQVSVDQSLWETIFIHFQLQGASVHRQLI